MTKKPVSPELALKFEEIRASMKIEGYDVSDETLSRAIESYQNNPYSPRFDELKAKAEREGREYAEVVNEELGLGIRFVELPEDEE